jgi:hypothetical protein
LREYFPAGVLHADGQWLPVIAANQFEGHIVEIVLDIYLLLPAVNVEILAEITLLIKQADAC